MLVVIGAIICVGIIAYELISPATGFALWAWAICTAVLFGRQ